LSKKIIPGTPGRPAHGFIDSPETSILFGRDVFIHDQLAQTLMVGQPVTFAVGLNSKGMPQAVDVVSEAQPLVMFQQGPAAAPMVPPSGERICELIYPEVCGALQNGLQEAVAQALIAAAEALGVSGEMQLHYASSAIADGHRQCNAAATMAKHQRWPGAGPMDGWQSSSWPAWSSPTWSRPKQRSDPYAATAMQALVPGPTGLPDHVQRSGPFEGLVKSVAPKSATCPHAYGFVTCQETQEIYGRDVFLHSNQVAELEQGARVRFEVALNQRGMPQAHNVIQLP